MLLGSLMYAAYYMTFLKLSTASLYIGAAILGLGSGLVWVSQVPSTYKRSRLKLYSTPNLVYGPLVGRLSLSQLGRDYLTPQQRVLLRHVPGLRGRRQHLLLPLLQGQPRNRRSHSKHLYRHPPLP